MVKVVSQNMVLMEALDVGEKKDDYDEKGPFPVVVDNPTITTHIHALTIDKLTCKKVERMS